MKATYFTAAEIEAIIANRAYTVSESFSGYYRLEDSHGHLLVDEPASEDYYDYDSALDLFLAYMAENPQYVVVAADGTVEDRFETKAEAEKAIADYREYDEGEYAIAINAVDTTGKMW